MTFSEKIISLLTLILLIIYTGTQAQIIQKTNFQGYQWAFFEWDSEIHPDDIEIQCNCIYRFDDEQIWILAAENEKVNFHINDTNITFIAERNPNFNKEWKEIEGNSLPTPITSEQLAAYRNYLGLKMLNKPAPVFSVSDLEGIEYTEKNLREKVTVLNFWFYGCQPCKRKVPVLNEIKKTHKSNTDINFWAFSSDPQLKGEEIYDFHHFPQTRWLTDRFNVIGHPTTFILDKNGIIRDVFNGMPRDADFLKNNLTRSINTIINEM